MAMATPMLPMDIPIMERGLPMLNLKPLLRPRLMPHICMEDITDLDMATPMLPMDIPIMERGMLMPHICMEDIMDLDMAMATPMLPMDIPIMERGLLMLNLRPRLMLPIFMVDIMDILMLMGVT